MEVCTTLDFYNTLLATESGRRVWAEMRKIANMWFRAEPPIKEHEAFAQCVLDEFILRIEEKCGLNTPETEKIILEAHAKAAAAALEVEKIEPENTDLHNIS